MTQINHQNDPVTIANKDANYEAIYNPIKGSLIPTLDDLQNNHPFYKYYPAVKKEISKGKK